MSGSLKERVFSLLVKRFISLAAVLFFPMPSFLSAEGFYADQFRLSPPGEPEVELSFSSSPIDWPAIGIEAGDAENAGTESREDADFDFAGLKSSEPIVILGQDFGYWTAVQSPYYVAQTVADQPPTLGGVGSAAPSSTTSIAPPMDAGTLTPSSGSIAPPAPTDSRPDFFSQPVQTMRRFWEGTSASYTFIPKNGHSGLGLNDFDFNMQFNFPCKCLPHANQDGVSGYWYLSPNFGLQLWNMPDLPDIHSMPGQTFDASLGFGAAPQFTQEIGADLWVQAGVASSFKKINGHAFFIRGRGLATIRINEQITALGGVMLMTSLKL